MGREEYKEPMPQICKHQFAGEQFFGKIKEESCAEIMGNKKIELGSPAPWADDHHHP
jgi:hypothetical protein